MARPSDMRTPSTVSITIRRTGRRSESSGQGLYIDGHGGGTNIATVDGSVRNYKYYDIVGYWIFGTDYTSARQHYDLTYPDNQ